MTVSGTSESQKVNLAFLLLNKRFKVRTTQLQSSTNDGEKSPSMSSEIVNLTHLSEEEVGE